jgi:hypothetical protein
MHVLLDRPLGDPELMGNAGVRATLGHEREHLPLSRRKDVERVFRAAGGDELLHEAGSMTDPPLTIRSSVSVNSSTFVTRLFSR